MTVTMKICGYLILSFWILYLLTINVVVAQNTAMPQNDSKLNPDWSYCFEFTWKGPEYDNYTRYNGTCEDYLDETRANNKVPCSPPFVITYDATPPDIQWLFDNHKSSVLCRRSNNQVCASYIYRYNGVVSNATYMCTKVQEIGGGAITSGCYIQEHEGYEMELCVCVSGTGVDFKPCNSATSLSSLSWLILLILFNFMITHFIY